MARALEELVVKMAPDLKEFWFDVDGVMTPQKPVVIYEMLLEGRVAAYERHDGLLRTPLVPLDENGEPVINRVEFFAAKQGRPIAEGYGFDTRDGKVVEYLREHNFPVFFISGRNSPVVYDRALALGATPLLGVKDKLSVIKERAQCSLSEILFIGDGIQDCETLAAVGLAIAPADACPEALALAHTVTVARGGGGVLNEVLSAFLKARGLWPDR